jgi:hypothetical protein
MLCRLWVRTPKVNFWRLSFMKVNTIPCQGQGPDCDRFTGFLVGDIPSHSNRAEKHCHNQDRFEDVGLVQSGIQGFADRTQHLDEDIR